MKQKILIENQFGHGAISISPIRRKIRNFFKPSVAKGLPFDWSTGFDVRDIIGPITIKNQGTNDSCGGQAGSYFLEIQRRLQKIYEGDISAKSIYSLIAYPGGGTTVPSLEKQIGIHGANLESLVPSMDANGNPLSEVMIEDTSWITPVTSQDALQRAGYTPYDVGTDINVIAGAIQAYGAVIWEIRGKSNGTWISAYPQPPLSNNSNPIFAHFMCLIGAKLVNGVPTLIALESMGTQQGDNGIQYFQANYTTSGYVVDCFTFVDDKRIVALPPSMSFWSNLLIWFHGMFASSSS